MPFTKQSTGPPNPPGAPKGSIPLHRAQQPAPSKPENLSGAWAFPTSLTPAKELVAELGRGCCWGKFGLEKSGWPLEGSRLYGPGIRDASRPEARGCLFRVLPARRGKRRIF